MDGNLNNFEGSIITRDTPWMAIGQIALELVAKFRGGARNSEFVFTRSRHLRAECEEAKNGWKKRTHRSLFPLLRRHKPRTHTYWPSTDFRINSADKKNSFESGRVGAKRKKIENLDERGVEIDIPWVDHRVTSFFHVYRILAYEKGITIYRAFRGADILGCTDRYLNSNYTRHRQTCCYHFSNLKFRFFAPQFFPRTEYLTYGFRYASDSRREDGSG